MSKLIVDVEQGVAALWHELTEPPTDGSQLPAEATGPVIALADKLGLDRAHIGPIEAGHLFDLINTVVESVAEGTAPGAEQQQQQPAAGQQDRTPGEAAIEPAGEKAPVSAGQQQTAVVESPPAAPLQPGNPPHGPADTDLPPVTAPQPGNEICPKCAGFRTILDSGAVVVCPECRGAGEVPVTQQPAG